MNHSRPFKALTALFTVITFITTSVIWSPDSSAAAQSIRVSAPSAAPEVMLSYKEKLDPGIRFSIPQELGDLQYFKPGKGPMVVHLQTAHGHYQAQEQIRALLHHLDKQYGIKTLLVEGSAFKLDPAILDFFPANPKLTQEANDALTRAALVKGPELYLLDQYHATKKGDVRAESRAYGIENLEAYRENGVAFVDVLTEKNKSEKFLTAMNEGIDRLAAAYLNDELRTFLKNLESHEKGRMPFEAWLAFLRKESLKRLKLDLGQPAAQLDWPMLVRIFKVQELAARFDRSAFEKERKGFLDILRRFLPRSGNGTLSEIEQLLNGDPVSRQLPALETGMLFEDMVKALPRDFNYRNYPNVCSFVGSLLLQSEIDAPRLMKETERLSSALVGKLAGTQTEKDLVELLKDHRLLQKLFALELTPTDYETVFSRKEAQLSLRPSDVARRFAAIQKKESISRVKDIRFEHLADLDALFDAAMKFYAGVKERDGLMEQMVEKRLRETGEGKVAVITGGFHSEPFKNYFASKDYSYALISPRITGADGAGHRAYVENMLKFTKHTPRAAQLSTRNGALSPMATREATFESVGLAQREVLAPENPFQLDQTALRDEVRTIISRVAGRSEVRGLPANKGRLTVKSEQRIKLSPENTQALSDFQNVFSDAVQEMERGELIPFVKSLNRGFQNTTLGAILVVQAIKKVDYWTDQGFVKMLGAIAAELGDGVLLLDMLLKGPLKIGPRFDKALRDAKKKSFSGVPGELSGFIRDAKQRRLLKESYPIQVREGRDLLAAAKTKIEEVIRDLSSRSEAREVIQPLGEAVAVRAATVSRSEARAGKPPSFTDKLKLSIKSLWSPEKPARPYLATRPAGKSSAAPARGAAPSGRFPAVRPTGANGRATSGVPGKEGVKPSETQGAMRPSPEECARRLREAEQKFREDSEKRRADENFMRWITEEQVKIDSLRRELWDTAVSEKERGQVLTAMTRKPDEAGRSAEAVIEKGMTKDDAVKNFCDDYLAVLTVLPAGEIPSLDVVRFIYGLPLINGGGKEKENFWKLPANEPAAKVTVDALARRIEEFQHETLDGGRGMLGTQLVLGFLLRRLLEVLAPDPKDRDRFLNRVFKDPKKADRLLNSLIRPQTLTVEDVKGLLEILSVYVEVKEQLANLWGIRSDDVVRFGYGLPPVDRKGEERESIGEMRGKKPDAERKIEELIGLMKDKERDYEQWEAARWKRTSDGDEYNKGVKERLKIHKLVLGFLFRQLMEAVFPDRAERERVEEAMSRRYPEDNRELVGEHVVREFYTTYPVARNVLGDKNAFPEDQELQPKDVVRFYYGVPLENDGDMMRTYGQLIVEMNKSHSPSARAALEKVLGTTRKEFLRIYESRYRALMRMGRQNLIPEETAVYGEMFLPDLLRNFALAANERSALVLQVSELVAEAERLRKAWEAFVSAEERNREKDWWANALVEKLGEIGGSLESPWEGFPTEENPEKAESKRRSEAELARKRAATLQRHLLFAVISDPREQEQLLTAILKDSQQAKTLLNTMTEGVFLRLEPEELEILQNTLEDFSNVYLTARKVLADLKSKMDNEMFPGLEELQPEDMVRFFYGIPSEKDGRTMQGYRDLLKEMYRAHRSVDGEDRERSYKETYETLLRDACDAFISEHFLQFRILARMKWQQVSDCLETGRQTAFVSFGELLKNLLLLTDREAAPVSHELGREARSISSLLDVYLPPKAREEEERWVEACKKEIEKHGRYLVSPGKKLRPDAEDLEEEDVEVGDFLKRRAAGQGLTEIRRVTTMVKSPEQAVRLWTALIAAGFLTPEPVVPKDLPPAAKNLEGSFSGSESSKDSPEVSRAFYKIYLLAKSMFSVTPELRPEDMVRFFYGVPDENDRDGVMQRYGGLLKEGHGDAGEMRKARGAFVRFYALYLGKLVEMGLAKRQVFHISGQSQSETFLSALIENLSFMTDDTVLSREQAVKESSSLFRAYFAAHSLEMIKETIRKKDELEKELKGAVTTQEKQLEMTRRVLELQRSIGFFQKELLKCVMDRDERASFFEAITGDLGEATKLLAVTDSKELLPPEILEWFYETFLRSGEEGLLQKAAEWSRSRGKKKEERENGGQRTGATSGETGRHLVGASSAIAGSTGAKTEDQPMASGWASLSQEDREAFGKFYLEAVQELESHGAFSGVTKPQLEDIKNFYFAEGDENVVREYGLAVMRYANSSATDEEREQREEALRAGRVAFFSKHGVQCRVLAEMERQQILVPGAGQQAALFNFKGFLKNLPLGKSPSSEGLAKGRHLLMKEAESLIPEMKKENDTWAETLAGGIEGFEARLATQSLGQKSEKIKGMMAFFQQCLLDATIPDPDEQEQIRAVVSSLRTDRDRLKDFFSVYAAAWKELPGDGGLRPEDIVRFYYGIPLAKDKDETMQRFGKLLTEGRKDDKDLRAAREAFMRFYGPQLRVLQSMVDRQEGASFLAFIENITFMTDKRTVLSLERMNKELPLFLQTLEMWGLLEEISREFREKEVREEASALRERWPGTEQPVEETSQATVDSFQQRLFELAAPDTGKRKQLLTGIVKDPGTAEWFLTAMAAGERLPREILQKVYEICLADWGKGLVTVGPVVPEAEGGNTQRPGTSTEHVKEIPAVKKTAKGELASMLHQNYEEEALEAFEKIHGELPAGEEKPSTARSSYPGLKGFEEEVGRVLNEIFPEPAAKAPEPKAMPAGSGLRTIPYIIPPVVVKNAKEETGKQPSIAEPSVSKAHEAVAKPLRWTDLSQEDRKAFEKFFSDAIETLKGHGTVAGGDGTQFADMKNFCFPESVEDKPFMRNYGSAIADATDRSRIEEERKILEETLDTPRETFIFDNELQCRVLAQMERQQELASAEGSHGAFSGFAGLLVNLVAKSRQGTTRSRQELAGERDRLVKRAELLIPQIMEDRIQWEKEHPVRRSEIRAEDLIEAAVYLAGILGFYGIWNFANQARQLYRKMTLYPLARAKIDEAVEDYAMTELPALLGSPASDEGSHFKKVSGFCVSLWNIAEETMVRINEALTQEDEVLIEVVPGGEEVTVEWESVSGDDGKMPAETEPRQWKGSLKVSIHAKDRVEEVVLQGAQKQVALAHSRWKLLNKVIPGAKEQKQLLAVFLKDFKDAEYFWVLMTPGELLPLDFLQAFHTVYRVARRSLANVEVAPETLKPEDMFLFYYGISSKGAQDEAMRRYGELITKRCAEKPDAERSSDDAEPKELAAAREAFLRSYSLQYEILTKMAGQEISDPWAARFQVSVERFLENLSFMADGKTELSLQELKEESERLDEACRSLAGKGGNSAVASTRSEMRTEGGRNAEAMAQTYLSEIAQRERRIETLKKQMRDPLATEEQKRENEKSIDEAERTIAFYQQRLFEMMIPDTKEREHLLIAVTKSLKFEENLWNLPETEGILYRTFFNIYSAARTVLPVEGKLQPQDFVRFYYAIPSQDDRGEAMRKYGELLAKGHKDGKLRAARKEFIRVYGSRLEGLVWLAQQFSPSWPDYFLEGFLKNLLIMTDGKATLSLQQLIEEVRALKGARLFSFLDEKGEQGAGLRRSEIRTVSLAIAVAGILKIGCLAAWVAWRSTKKKSRYPLTVSQIRKILADHVAARSGLAIPLWWTLPEEILAQIEEDLGGGGELRLEVVPGKNGLRQSGRLTVEDSPETVSGSIAKRSEMRAEEDQDFNSPAQVLELIAERERNIRTLEKELTADGTAEQELEDVRRSIVLEGKVVRFLQQRLLSLAIPDPDDRKQFVVSVTGDVDSEMWQEDAVAGRPLPSGILGRFYDVYLAADKVLADKKAFPDFGGLQPGNMVRFYYGLPSGKDQGEMRIYGSLLAGEGHNGVINDLNNARRKNGLEPLETLEAAREAFIQIYEVPYRALIKMERQPFLGGMDSQLLTVNEFLGHVLFMAGGKEVAPVHVLSMEERLLKKTHESLAPGTKTEGERQVDTLVQRIKELHQLATPLVQQLVTLVIPTPKEVEEFLTNTKRKLPGGSPSPEDLSLSLEHWIQQGQSWPDILWYRGPDGKFREGDENDRREQLRVMGLEMESFQWQLLTMVFPNPTEREQLATAITRKAEQPGSTVGARARSRWISRAFFDVYVAARKAMAAWRAQEDKEVFPDLGELQPEDMVRFYYGLPPRGNGNAMRSYADLVEMLLKSDHLQDSDENRALEKARADFVHELSLQYRLLVQMERQQIIAVDTDDRSVSLTVEKFLRNLLFMRRRKEVLSLGELAAEKRALREAFGSGMPDEMRVEDDRWTDSLAQIIRRIDQEAAVLGQERKAKGGPGGENFKRNEEIKRKGAFFRKHLLEAVIQDPKDLGVLTRNSEKMKQLQDLMARERGLSPEDTEFLWDISGDFCGVYFAAKAALEAEGAPSIAGGLKPQDMARFFYGIPSKKDQGVMRIYGGFLAGEGHGKKVNILNEMRQGAGLEPLETLGAAREAFVRHYRPQMEVLAFMFWMGSTHSISEYRSEASFAALLENLAFMTDGRATLPWEELIEETLWLGDVAGIEMFQGTVDKVIGEADAPNGAGTHDEKQNVALEEAVHFANRVSSAKDRLVQLFPDPKELGELVDAAGSTEELCDIYVEFDGAVGEEKARNMVRFYLGFPQEEDKQGVMQEYGKLLAEGRKDSAEMNAVREAFVRSPHYASRIGSLISIEGEQSGTVLGLGRTRISVAKFLKRLLRAAEERGALSSEALDLDKEAGLLEQAQGDQGGPDTAIRRAEVRANEFRFKVVPMQRATEQGAVPATVGIYQADGKMLGYFNLPVGQEAGERTYGIDFLPHGKGNWILHETTKAQFAVTLDPNGNLEKVGTVEIELPTDPKKVKNFTSIPTPDLLVINQKRVETLRKELKGFLESKIGQKWEADRLFLTDTRGQGGATRSEMRMGQSSLSLSSGFMFGEAIRTWLNRPNEEIIKSNQKELESDVAWGVLVRESIGSQAPGIAGLKVAVDASGRIVAVIDPLDFSFGTQKKIDSGVYCEVIFSVVMLHTPTPGMIRMKGTVGLRNLSPRAFKNIEESVKRYNEALGSAANFKAAVEEIRRQLAGGIPSENIPLGKIAEQFRLTDREHVKLGFVWQTWKEINEPEKTPAAASGSFDSKGRSEVRGEESPSPFKVGDIIVINQLVEAQVRAIDVEKDNVILRRSVAGDNVDMNASLQGLLEAIHADRAQVRSGGEAPSAQPVKKGIAARRAGNGAEINRALAPQINEARGRMEAEGKSDTGKKIDNFVVLLQTAPRIEVAAEEIKPGYNKYTISSAGDYEITKLEKEELLITAPSPGQIRRRALFVVSKSEMPGRYDYIKDRLERLSRNASAPSRSEMRGEQPSQSSLLVLKAGDVFGNGLIVIRVLSIDEQKRTVKITRSGAEGSGAITSIVREASLEELRKEIARGNFQFQKAAATTGEYVPGNHLREEQKLNLPQTISNLREILGPTKSIKVFSQEETYHEIKYDVSMVLQRLYEIIATDMRLWVKGWLLNGEWGDLFVVYREETPDFYQEIKDRLEELSRNITGKPSEGARRSEMRSPETGDERLSAKDAKKIRELMKPAASMLYYFSVLKWRITQPIVDKVVRIIQGVASEILKKLHNLLKWGWLGKHNFNWLNSDSLLPNELGDNFQNVIPASQEYLDRHRKDFWKDALFVGGFRRSFQEFPSNTYFIIDTNSVRSLAIAAYMKTQGVDVAYQFPQSYDPEHPFGVLPQLLMKSFGSPVVPKLNSLATSINVSRNESWNLKPLEPANFPSPDALKKRKIERVVWLTEERMKTSAGANDVRERMQAFERAGLKVDKYVIMEPEIYTRQYGKPENGAPPDREPPQWQLSKFEDQFFDVASLSARSEMRSGQLVLNGKTRKDEIVTVLAKAKIGTNGEQRQAIAKQIVKMVAQKGQAFRVDDLRAIPEFSDLKLEQYFKIGVSQARPPDKNGSRFSASLKRKIVWGLIGGVLLTAVSFFIVPMARERFTADSKDPAPISAPVRYDHGQFHVVYDAHSTQQDFENVRGVLDELVRRSEPDPERYGFPQLFIIDEGVISVEQVCDHISSPLVLNTAEDILQDQYKPLLKSAYEQIVEQSRILEEEADRSMLETRINNAEYFIQAGAFPTWAKGYLVPYVRWKARAGVRIRLDRMDFEDWYEFSKVYYLTRDREAFLSGDMVRFFEEFRRLSRMMVRTNTARDGAANRLAQSLLQRYPKANVAYVIGSNHRTDREIILNQLKGEEHLTVPAEAAGPLSYTEEILEKYKKGSFDSTSEEKDSVARAAAETYTMSLMPDTWSYTNLMRVLRGMFERARKDGLTPWEAMGRISTTQGSGNVLMEGDVSFEEAFVTTAHQLGWVPDEDYRAMMATSRSEMRLKPVASSTSEETRRSEMRTVVVGNGNIEGADLASVLSDTSTVATPVPATDALLGQVGRYLQGLPDTELNTVLNAHRVKFPGGVRDKLLKAFKTASLGAFGQQINEEGIMTLAVSPDRIKQLTKDDKEYRVAWLGEDGKIYLLERFYAYLNQIANEDERIKTAAALFARLLISRVFIKILRDSQISINAVISEKIGQSVRAVEDLTFAKGPVLLDSSRVDRRARGFVYQQMHRRNERPKRSGRARVDWGPQVRRMEWLIERLTVLYDQFEKARAVSAESRKAIEDIAASFRLDDKSEETFQRKTRGMDATQLEALRAQFQRGYVAMESRIAAAVRNLKEQKIDQSVYDESTAKWNRSANGILSRMVRIDFALIGIKFREKASIRIPLDMLLDDLTAKVREMKWKKVREQRVRNITEVFVQNAGDDYLRVTAVKSLIKRVQRLTGAVERVESRWSEEDTYYLATLKQLLTALIDSESAITADPAFWKDKLLGYLWMRKVDFEGRTDAGLGVNDIAAALYLARRTSGPAISGGELTNDVLQRIKDWTSMQTVIEQEPRVAEVKALVNALLPDEKADQEELKRVRYQNLYNFFRSRDHALEFYDREHRKAWTAIGFLNDLVYQLRDHERNRNVLPAPRLRSAQRDLDEVASWVEHARVHEKTRIRDLVRIAQECLDLGDYVIVVANAREAQEILEGEFLTRIGRMSRYIARHRQAVTAEFEGALNLVRSGIRTGSRRDFRKAFTAMKRFKVRFVDGYTASEDEPGYVRAKRHFTGLLDAFGAVLEHPEFPSRAELEPVLKNLYRITYDIELKYEKIADIGPEAKKIEREINARVAADLVPLPRSEMREETARIAEYLAAEFGVADHDAKIKEVAEKIAIEFGAKKCRSVDDMYEIVKILKEELGFELRRLSPERRGNILTVVHGMSTRPARIARFREIVRYFEQIFDLKVRDLNDDKKQPVVTSAFYLSQAKADPKRGFKDGIGYAREFMETSEIYFGFTPETIRGMEFSDKSSLMAAVYYLTFAKNEGFSTFVRMIDEICEVFGIGKEALKTDAVALSDKMRVMTAAYAVSRRKGDGFSTFVRTIDEICKVFGIGKKALQTDAVELSDKIRVMTVAYVVSLGKGEGFSTFVRTIDEICKVFGIGKETLKTDAVALSDKIRVMTAAYYVSRGTGEGFSTFVQTIEKIYEVFGIGKETLKTDAVALSDKLRVMTVAYGVSPGKDEGFSAFVRTIDEICKVFGIGKDSLKSGDIELGDKLRVMTAASQVSLGKDEGVSSFVRTIDEICKVFGIGKETLQTDAVELSDKIRMMTAAYFVTRRKGEGFSAFVRTIE